MQGWGNKFYKNGDYALNKNKSLTFTFKII
jgi:hypothetical protein